MLHDKENIIIVLLIAVLQIVGAMAAMLILRQHVQPQCATLTPTNVTYDVVLRWAGPPVADEFGELRYALRSLENNADVNQVHIVAAGKVPTWVDRREVNCINEDVIIALGMKRINGSVEEAQRSSELCKIGFDLIPHLHERFVVMDDDYLLLHNRVPFFAQDGTPIVPSQIYMCHRALPFTKTIYAKKASKISSTFFSPGKRRFDYDIFPTMYEDTDVHKIPWSTQVLPEWTHASCSTYWLNDITVERHYVKRLLNYVLRHRPCFVCINDDWVLCADKDKHRADIEQFYKLLFPDVSRFERHHNRNELQPT